MPAVVSRFDLSEARGLVEDNNNSQGPERYHAPQIRTAAEQILNNPYLRRRLIVHEPFDNGDGTVDYHKGREINPAGSERKKYGPRAD